MQIVYKPIAVIKPYEKNPRKNDNAVDKVASSIKEFGFKSPIIIDGKGVIIAGHTRYKAAQKLGMQEVPCIVADDLTKEQVKAYRLADNKVSEYSEWDFELLHAELDDLTKAFDFDMSDFGFYVLEDDCNFDELFVSKPSEQPKKPKKEEKETQVQEPEQTKPEAEEEHAEIQPVEAPESAEKRFMVKVQLDSLERANELVEALQKDGYSCEVVEA